MKIKHVKIKAMTYFTLALVVFYLTGCKNNTSENETMCSVALQATDGKIISDPEIQGKVKKNTVITFYAIPNNKLTHKVDSWEIKGGEVLESGNDKKYVKVKIVSDAIIKVNFVEILYTITMEALGGTIVAEPSIVNGKVSKNTVITFTATPNNDKTHEVDAWQIIGGEVLEGGNKEGYAKVKITNDATIKVTFKEKPKFTVVISPTENGSVNSDVDITQSVYINTIITFTATPENLSTYEVDNWDIDGVEVIDGARTGSLIAKVKIINNTTVKVTFAKKSYFDAESGKGNVGNVEFIMKHIDAVNDVDVGHNDEDDNKPHKVSLSAYLIGETEVTRELFKQVVGQDVSASTDKPHEGEIQAKRPVEMVSWYRAIFFCNKLSLKVGLEPCYSIIVNGKELDFATFNFEDIPKVKNEAWDACTLDMNKKGFRLPTEAEWEWAARGGKNFKWCDTDDKTEVKKYAWFDINSNEKTHQVAIEKVGGVESKNGYGLYDMGGNVFEWCQDWYSPSTPVGGKDPIGASTGDAKVMRGGSWHYDVAACACSYRNYLFPADKNSLIGIRLVCRK